MLFNSFSFAVFLPIVFGIYWVMPHKFRWVVLLMSSCYFYMSWNTKYIILILFTTFVSYISAILIERFDNKPACARPADAPPSHESLAGAWGIPEFMPPNRRRDFHSKKNMMLAVTLISSLGILFIFKYFNFASHSITVIFQKLSIPVHPITLKLMLPVGISFYTFQTLSYVLDVYKGRIKAELHFGKYAAFVTFFPQLVAGPIERTENLLQQIREKHEFDYDQATYGMKLMAWGFFKKLVIADNLAVYVDRIYNDVYSYKGFSFVVSTIFFAFQIYCDFSGYSDIASGTARLFGINLMTNFNSPYFSATIKEFWSRWHISLSTWFRDYIYIPLGGSRKGTLRQYANLMITFLISGAWHGASWNYFIWGGVHGSLQIAENVFRIKTDRERKHNMTWFLSVTGVFVVVCICWILFRAENIREAFYIITHALDGISDTKQYILNGYWDLQLSKEMVIKIFLSLVILLVCDYVSLKENVIDRLSRMPIKCRWGIYYGIIILIIFWGRFGSSQFVYFQF